MKYDRIFAEISGGIMSKETFETNIKRRIEAINHIKDNSILMN